MKASVVRKVARSHSFGRRLPGRSKASTSSTTRARLPRVACRNRQPPLSQGPGSAGTAGRRSTSQPARDNGRSAVPVHGYSAWARERRYDASTGRKGGSQRARTGSRSQVRHARQPLRNSRKTLKSPAAMKNGDLDTAPKAANSAVGNHHRNAPVRIILSAKNRNQRVTVRHKPLVLAYPACRTINGSPAERRVPHQATRSPRYCRANWKNGQSAVANKSNDTKLAHPSQVEPVALNASAAAACHSGNSCAVGVPVALNPTTVGRNRSIEPRAYSSAGPIWRARKSGLPRRALPR